jgi:hypothetical protein
VVLEWNGSPACSPLPPARTGTSGSPTILETGRILMGQRRGTPSANDTGGLYATTHFLPGVFELTWTGNDYQAGRRFPLPDDMTIYRFAMGDIFNDGARSGPSPIPLDDELRIYDPAGTTPVGRPGDDLAATRFSSKPPSVHRFPDQRPDLPDPAFCRCRS